MVSLKRYSFQEAVDIIDNADILELAALADGYRKKLHPGNVVTYVVDRNINYTNICVCKCRFCAFYKDIKDPSAYLMDFDTLALKIQETINAGGRQILIQGGLHPLLGLSWYTDMLRFIKSNFDIWVHGFSPPEISHIANVSKLSVRETISSLMDAGLDSIPGGGAEVLSDVVRKEISPNKISASKWLGVMEEAHNLGLKTTATMMFRKEEKAENIVEHLLRVRELQDKTGGFTAFIPWPFQPGNTELGGKSTTPLEYLRILAAGRIVLDNIPNIQVSWVTQGADVGQIGLFFGANDFGSVMMEENVVKAAGTGYSLQEEEIRALISGAGFIPKARNMLYEIL